MHTRPSRSSTRGEHGFFSMMSSPGPAYRAWAEGEGMRPSSVPAHAFDSYFSSLLQPCFLPRPYVQLSIG